MEELGNMFLQYNLACGFDIKKFDKINKNIRDRISLSENKDINIFLFNLFLEFSTEYPQYYFNDKVESEVFNFLNDYYNEDNSKLIKAFAKNQELFFNTLTSFDRIVKSYQELENKRYDLDEKVNIYYIPMYQQIMEFCISKIYEFICLIYGEYVNKNYKHQKLSSLIDTINKINQFDSFINLNENLRNAISHGKIKIMNDCFFYTYKDKEKGAFETKELKFDKFIDLIEEKINIIGGSIVAILRFINKYDLYKYLLREEFSEDIRFEWLKLFFRNRELNIYSFKIKDLKSKMLEIHIKTSIKDINNLLRALLQIVKVTNIFFPSYDLYYFTFTHERNLEGTLYINREDIFLEDEKILDSIISKKTFFMIDDIRDESISIENYKFFAFPKIYGDNWQILNLEDNSTHIDKRFICKLILNEKLNKDEIKKIVNEAINKIKSLYNPPNPKYKIVNGNIEARIIFIDVFCRNRGKDYLISYSKEELNKNFICKITYYRNKSVKRIPLIKWYTNTKLFEIEIDKNIEYIWNKKVKFNIENVDTLHIPLIDENEQKEIIESLNKISKEDNEIDHSVTRIIKI